MSVENKHFKSDTVFQLINKHFVSLSEEEIKENNIHLSQVIDKLLTSICNQDAFFKEVYQEKSFSGSYYKKTKVGKPNEYDLNIIIKLPINYNNVKISDCYPGYAQIDCKSCFLNCFTNTDRNLKKLLDINLCLDQEKFRRWMESMFDTTIKKLQEEKPYYILNTDNRPYKIRVEKHGPAFTLYIKVSSDEALDVDLVPVLKFSCEMIPHMPHELIRFKKQTWYAVPKPLNQPNSNLYWRMSFYDQEKEILEKYGNMKQVLRQIKKLRDTQNWKRLASYYIETLFLHACNNENVNLTNKSYTTLFMMMLEQLDKALDNKCIPYYWNKNLNLLAQFGCSEIATIKGRLKHIIKDIKAKIENDQYIIARYVLTQSELCELQSLIYQSSNDEKSNSGNCTIW